MDSFSEREIQSSDTFGKLTLSALHLSHLPQIREIASGSFPVLWSEKDFSYFLTQENRRCMGLFQADKLLCYCLALLCQGDLDIVSLATREEARRKGVAKMLLKELEKGKSVHRLYLEVESDNAPALALYEGAGFKKYGLRKKYYQGVKDAVLMMKERDHA